MFDAVLDLRPVSPLDFDDRLRALVAFLALPEAASLTAANKRIANILKKSGEQAGPRVDPRLLSDRGRAPARRPTLDELRHGSRAARRRRGATRMP